MNNSFILGMGRNDSATCCTAMINTTNGNKSMAPPGKAKASQDGALRRAIMAADSTDNRTRCSSMQAVSFRRASVTIFIRSEISMDIIPIIML